jgi:hypothetical protein
MTRILIAIGGLVLTLLLFNSNVVRAACTVWEQFTIKTQDEVTTECIWNAPSNAYIIIKEVTWSITWFESTQGSELYVTGSGQCSGIIFATKCFPAFPAGHSADNGHKWVQERADKTYTNGSCQQKPYVAFERNSSAIMECNQNSQECQELSLYYWNFTNSTCNSSPASGNCGGGPDWTNYFSSGVTPAWDCSAAASATAAPPSKVTAANRRLQSAILRLYRLRHVRRFTNIG